MMNRYPRTGHGRGQPLPGWASSIAMDTWTAIPNTTYITWANANLPAGAYLGTNPFGAITDAYCDPANDDGAQYFYGGGHGDGTCNAVVKFDFRSLSYSLVGQPTPPSVYLPGYPSTVAIAYPSGVKFEDSAAYPFSGWFLDASRLPSSLDAAYRAPALARTSTHMYGAAVKRGTVIHYFYLAYGEFDTATGLWSGNTVDLAAQVYAISANYNDLPLQQGTVAHYDPVTDRMFVTFNPGDAGGAWRSGLIVFNPSTRTVESIIQIAGAYGLILNSCQMTPIGRKLYVTQKAGSGVTYTMNTGVIVDMDTHALQAWTLSGDVSATTMTSGASQDTILQWWDGRAIRRWNYSTTYNAIISSFSVVPASGTGTTADPFVFAQTTRTVISPPTIVNATQRFVYDPLSGCVLGLPISTSNFYALKLS